MPGTPPGGRQDHSNYFGNQPPLRYRVPSKGLEAWYNHKVDLGVDARCRPNDGLLRVQSTQT